MNPISKNLIWSSIYLYLRAIPNWRKINEHSFTYPRNIFDFSRVCVGKMSYGELNVVIESKENAKLIIGDYCSIAPNTTFLIDAEHTTRTISTYPFKVLKFQQDKEAGTKGDIKIKSDVWIEMNCTICSGITI